MFNAIYWIRRGSDVVKVGGVIKLIIQQENLSSERG